jgi:outer membrane immunogenic protein
MNRLQSLLGSVAGAGILLASGGAFAADLPIQTQAQVYAPAAGFSWTGLYVGVNAGGGFGGSFSGTGTGALAGGTLTVDRPSGFIGGGQIGFNYQLTPGSGFVIGIEGDVQFADIASGISVATPLGTASVRAETDDWMATVRGRVGYAWGSTMAYVTGGAAFTDIRLSASIPGATGSVTNGHTGWTIGAGLEMALWGNWSAKAEYNYITFERANYAIAAGVGENVDLDTHVLRLGLNYRF